MDTKVTNPKDAVGSRKAGLRFVPRGPLYEVGLALLEGALKYGTHNWRVAGVRASVYIDAAEGHLDAFWEGEDLDPDSQLSHITKAIAGLLVLRDSMMQGNWTDDRPVVNPGGASRRNLSDAAARLIDACPNPKPPNIQSGSAAESHISGEIHFDPPPDTVDVTLTGPGRGACVVRIPRSDLLKLLCNPDDYFGLLNGVPSDYPS